jgi:Fe-S-cluster-containing dehydrogenase component
MFACSRRTGKIGFSNSSIFIKSKGGISTGYSVIVCYACENPPCARVCPTEALVPKEGGGVKLIKEKCIGCGLCKEACVLNAVFWDKTENKPSICVQCGFCVKFCPHGVLELKK